MAAPISPALQGTTYTLYDMTPGDIASVEIRMRPGQYSSAGFLDQEERLMDVFQRDIRTLEELGLNCRQISEVIKGILHLAWEHYNSTMQSVRGERFDLVLNVTAALIRDGIKVAGKFYVRGIGLATNGSQRCPFSNPKDPCPEGREDFEIRNLESGEVLCISSLVIHMIEKHGFFEGNTPFRAEPRVLDRVFEVRARDYERVIERKLVWVSCDDYSVEAEEHARQHAEKIIHLNDSVTAYMGVPYKDYDTQKRQSPPVYIDIDSDSEFGLRESDLQPMIEFSDVKPLDSHTVVPKKYCHLYVRRDLSKGEIFEPDGIRLSSTIQWRGVHVYEINEESYARI